LIKTGEGEMIEYVVERLREEGFIALKTTLT